MLADNLAKVQQELALAMAARDKNFVSGTTLTIVAATKTQSPETLQQALALGIKIFGENKVQEAQTKTEHVVATWHLIGHLQTNKVKQAVKIFDLIHSVDSIHLMQEIDKQAGKIGKVQNILLQVNIACEASKSGFAEDMLADAANFTQTLQYVNLKGIMVIAPHVSEENLIREIFRRGYTNFAQLKSKHNSVEILSMGMSEDYILAVQEGSNMIRLGSKLFGARTYNKN